MTFRTQVDIVPMVGSTRQLPLPQVGGSPTIGVSVRHFGQRSSSRCATALLGSPNPGMDQPLFMGHRNRLTMPPF